MSYWPRRCCGPPAMLEGPVFICNAVCTCMDGCQISSTSKGKPSLSNEYEMTDFRQTWYVGSGGVTSITHVVCCHQMRTSNTSFTYLFSLANNKKSQISRVLYGLHWWNLGMWVVMGTSTTHIICCHQMCIFIASFAYLFYLANDKKNQICNNWYAHVKSDLNHFQLMPTKGCPRCTFCEYSEGISRELQNSSFDCFDMCDLLKFLCHFEFPGQFTIRCMHYFLKKCW